MTEQSHNHALVLGASGLIGWSVVQQLISSYPHANSFTKITAITNRAVKIEDSYWPAQKDDECRPELKLVSGIDLRKGDGGSLVDGLREKVIEVEGVTHVFYFVFTQVDDPVDEVEVNKGMLKGVVDALNILCPKLQFLVFPGGTRGYGIYIPGGTFKAPLTEDLVNNLPEDYAKTVAYPSFREILSAASKDKKWTWCEICPDAIIGFTPNGSQWSLALHWAQYLSLYSYKHNVNPHTNPNPNSTNNNKIKIPFPGNQAGYTSLSTSVSAKTIAKFAIYASLNLEKCGGGRLFNIADQEKPTSFRDIWPRLAEWFGLVGVGPTDLDGEASSLRPGEYNQKHRRVFEKFGLEKAGKAGVGAGSSQLDSVGWWLTFDRQLSLERLRESGFVEERDPIEGWLESFEMFRRAGLIL